MKRLAYLTLFFSFLMSCEGTSEESNSEENQSTEQPEAEVIPLCEYNPEHDISDSLIMLCDEALEKGQDFNPTKWSVNFEKWAGMSFSLEAEITDIHNSEIQLIGGKPKESKPYLSLEYGSTKYPIVGGATIFLDVHFEKNEELVNYEVGQKIKVEGVLEDPYINLDPQSVTGSFDWYWIHTNCCKVVSES
ncbi:MAG: hypothetical protein R2780_14595 [Crocinitomicaceae bacterium]|nr:hypothetical protein [Crocinitomicaceae bacterium]